MQRFKNNKYKQNKQRKRYILDDIKIPNVKYKCRVDYIKETISIGCQTISFSTLENIINLIK